RGPAPPRPGPRHVEDMNMRPSLKELDAYQLADMLTDEHPRLAEPARLSCLLHEGQMRGPRGSKHRTPYAEHPLRATLRLAPAGVSDEVTLTAARSEEHTSELQSRFDLVCRLLLEKKKIILSHRIFHKLTKYLTNK